MLSRRSSATLKQRSSPNNFMEMAMPRKGKPRPYKPEKISRPNGGQLLKKYVRLCLEFLGAILLATRIWQLFQIVSIEFPIMYVDMRPQAAPITIKNTGFLFPLRNVTPVLHYEYFRIKNGPSSQDSYSLIRPIPEIFPGHEAVRDLSQGLRNVTNHPIESVQGLATISISYQVWWFPWYRVESYTFYATKESDYSVRWRQK